MMRVQKQIQTNVFPGALALSGVDAASMFDGLRHVCGNVDGLSSAVAFNSPKMMCVETGMNLSEGGM